MQMECGVNPTSTGEQAGQQRVRVLGTCHTCLPTRFHNNGGNAGQEVRDCSLPARMIHIFKLVLLQKLNPNALGETTSVVINADVQRGSDP